MPEVTLRGGRVDGLALHYVVEGRGPAVVLLHGLGGFAESWRHNIPALARRATVHALDLPGFGRSPKPRAGYRLADLTEALHGFVEALSLPEVSLVGHSLGGAVAVTYALTHPARVERLALVGAVVPGFGYRLSPKARLLALPAVGEALVLFRSAGLYRSALSRCFHAPVRAEVDFLVAHDYGTRTSLAARQAFLAVLRGLRVDLDDREGDYRRAIATLDLPTLLIHGREDPVVPPAYCARAAGGFPRGVARWIDACGHFPHIEHAQAVNTWLAEFLVGRPAPR